MNQKNSVPKHPFSSTFNTNAQATCILMRRIHIVLTYAGTGGNKVPEQGEDGECNGRLSEGSGHHAVDRPRSHGAHVWGGSGQGKHPHAGKRWLWTVHL